MYQTYKPLCTAALQFNIRKKKVVGKKSQISQSTYEWLTTESWVCVLNSPLDVVALFCVNVQCYIFIFYFHMV